MDTPKGSGRSAWIATPHLSERKRQLFRSRSDKLNNIEDDDDVEDSLLGLSPLKPHRRDMRKVNKNLFIGEEQLAEGRRLRSSSSSSPETNKENKKKSHGKGNAALAGGGGEAAEQLPHLFTKTMRLNSQSASSSPRTPKSSKRESGVAANEDKVEAQQMCNSSFSSPNSSDYANQLKAMVNCDSSTISPESPYGYPSASPRRVLKREHKSTPLPLDTSKKLVEMKAESGTSCSVISPTSSNGSPQSKMRKTNLEQSIPTMAFYSKTNAPSSRRNIVMRSGGGGNLRKRTARSKTSPTSSRLRLGINRGVSHNIRKPSALQARRLPPIQLDNILNSLRNEKLKEIINQKREERAKIEEVYQILRSAKDPIKMAKPLSVMKDDANNNMTNTDFSDLSEDEQQQLQENDDDDFAMIELEPIIPIIRHQPTSIPSEPSGDQVGKRKFFKSGRKSQTHMEVRITDHIRASVNHGKIELIRKRPKTPRRLRVKSSTIFSAEQATVDAILKNLDDSVLDDIVEASPSEEPPIIRSASVPLPDTISNAESEELNENLNCNFQAMVDPFASFRQRLPYNTQDQELIEQQQILLEFLISNNICTEENFTIFIAEPDTHKIEANKIVDELYTIINAEEAPKEAEVPVPETVTPVVPSEKLFPIFNQRLQPLVQRSQRHKAPSASDAAVVSRQRLLSSAAIGSNQYQIDAGQKQFGARQCQQCGLVYTVHEPEEEQLHREYHNSVHILRFKGWIDEDIIAACPEWSSDGRIIRLNERAPVARLQRLQDLLKVVDKELGYASIIMPKIFVAFFAVQKQQIVGLCLVQPLSQAHRFIQIDGIDYCSEEVFEASCGISRIWVSPLQRRQGIARKLMRAVQCHTILGQEIPANRIAFGSPTDDGRALARYITQNDNFLTFDQ
ncbi:N-acetyltransferase eco [Drosophila tropicalis]|uniref:N-acetyltransferase eco n=1 Tax=Drosophila tropicalis TaxID=46794 RepID=UPI0035AC0F1D